MLCSEMSSGLEHGRGNISLFTVLSGAKKSLGLLNPNPQFTLQLQLDQKRLLLREQTIY